MHLHDKSLNKTRILPVVAMAVLAACASPEEEAMEAVPRGGEPAAVSEKPVIEVPVPEQPPAPAALPNFRAIEHVPTLKETFFEFLRPIVESEIDRILDDRRFVASLPAGTFDSLSDSDQARLTEICEAYAVDIGSDLAATQETLLKRVDAVPPDLALVQAAIESGWGRSRFAREGYNLFGQWCFEEGCGIVPRARPADATYEVAAFESPRHAVRAYLRNVNTHRAYGKFRALRTTLREEGERLRAGFLAGGLEQYSEQGVKYVEKVRTMIRQNRDLLQGA